MNRQRKTDSVIPPLPAALRKQWDKVASRIKQRAKDLAEDVREIIALGDALTTESAKLPHGQIGPWLEAHFGQGSTATAYRYMNLADLAKILTVRNIVEAVSNHRVPLTFLYSFRPNVKRARETMSLGKGIDIVTSYQIHKKQKRCKSSGKKVSPNPVSPAVPVEVPPSVATSTEPPTPLPLAASTIPPTTATAVPAPPPPPSAEMMNVPGFLLPKSVYQKLRQLQDRFGTATIPATLTMLVDRELMAQKFAIVTRLRKIVATALRPATEAA